MIFRCALGALFLWLLSVVSANAQTSTGPCFQPIQPKIVAGTSYTLSTQDRCWFVIFTSAANVTVSLPAPGLIFAPGFESTLLPINGAQITLTGLPDQAGVLHSINNSPSLVLAAGSGALLKVQQDFNWWAVPTGGLGGGGNFSYPNYVVNLQPSTPPYAATDYFSLVQVGAGVKVPANSLLTLSDPQTPTNKQISCAGIPAANNCTSIPIGNLVGLLDNSHFGSLFGDVTSPGGSYSTTIALNAVTNAKAAQAPANTLKGNPTGSTANEQDIPLPSCPDSGGNHLNWVSGTGPTCGTSGGGGGSVSITAATPNIVATPSPLTGTGTIGTTVPLNTQSGNSVYTILSTDNTKLVGRTNTVTQTDAVPQATGSFASGFDFGYSTATVGNTVTSTSSTINGIAGATGIKLGPQQATDWTSDGTNWRVALGVPQPPTQTGTTVLLDTMTFGSPPATPLTTGTSVSLAGPRQYFVCTSTCTVTPPVPVAGYEFCVMNDDNVATVITLAALGSSARYENTARTAYGTAGTGTFVSGGATADKVCIVGRDATHYLTTSFNGTWTAN